jgi:hypothetical protein
MACMRCGDERQDRIRNLGLVVDGVPGRVALGINALRCCECGYLELELPNLMAAPQEIVEPHREN